VHVYTDREKTSFLTETRGPGAFPQEGRASTASTCGCVSATPDTSLPPNYDDPLKRHTTSATFGNTARELGQEPGFKREACPVHAYTDREKTSFLTETRSTPAFYHPPHAPSAKAAEQQASQTAPALKPRTAPSSNITRPRLLAPLRTSAATGSDTASSRASGRSPSRYSFSSAFSARFASMSPSKMGYRPPWKLSSPRQAPYEVGSTSGYPSAKSPMDKVRDRLSRATTTFKALSPLKRTSKSGKRATWHSVGTADPPAASLAKTMPLPTAATSKLPSVRIDR